MKCNCITRTGITGKKRKKRKTLRVFSLFNQIVHGMTPDNKAWNNPEAKDIEDTLCDGDVSVSVQTVNEPVYGGTSAVLEIEYFCNKCGNRDFRELPNSEGDLTTLVQGVLDNMTEEQRAERMVPHKEMADKLEEMRKKRR